MEENRCYHCKKVLHTIHDIFQTIYINMDDKSVIAYLCSYKCYLNNKKTC